MDLGRFVALRPYLFHLTASANVARIRRTGSIESAARLFAASARTDLLRVRRTQSQVVRIDGDDVHIRDQSPLHPGNMVLGSGLSFEDFVQSLNERVFFWPGTAAGPIAYGVRHFERYRSEHPALVRVLTASLLAANPDVVPLFCRFNSGSPRCTNGNPSPRGGDTFRPAADSDFAAGRVVEITYPERVHLPPDAEVGAEPTGPWASLS